MININVIVKNNNEEIIEGHPIIFIDDNIKVIKEKLFSFDKSLLPVFTKIKVKKDQDDEFITIDNENQLLYKTFQEFNFDNFIIDKEIPYEIYVSTILDTFENYSSKKIISLTNTDIKYKELDKLKIDFPQLSIEDFDYVLFLFLQNNPKYNIMKDNYETEINDYTIKIINPLYNKLYEKYNVDANSDLAIFNKLTQSNVSDIHMLRINNIKFIISGGNVTNKSFIDLKQVFNILELNENIPLIGLNGKGISSSRDPIFKIIDTDKINGISLNEIKTWILNEQKKKNRLIYKLVNGLLIKSKINQNTFLTINITETGVVSATLNIDNDNPISEYSFNKIKNMVMDNVDNIINNLNVLNIYTGGKRLQSTKDSLIKISKITLNIYTDTINKELLRKILNIKSISNTLGIDIKNNITDNLSFYYNKSPGEGSSERKGITVNIDDNPYKENESIIKILNTENIFQFNIILVTILLLTKMSTLKKKNGVIVYTEVQTKRKIKTTPNIKILAKKGIKIDSKKCQGKRQAVPNNDNEDPHDNSYLIHYKDLEFICKNIDYPYPGFTNDNMPCCFKKNQIGDTAFIKNMNPKSLDIFVKPSNFIIKITNANNKTFETYVLKVTSNYKPELSAKNTFPRYYYINPILTNNNSTQYENSAINELIPIYNEDLINLIEEQERSQDIFLKEVPLSTIIYSDKKCKYKPNMLNRSSKNINKPCKGTDRPFFMYNQDGIPCCSNKKPTLITKTSNSTKTNSLQNYIIQQSNNELQYGQIGVLPQDLNELLNTLPNLEATARQGTSEIFADNNSNGIFYRMGINQTNPIDSFLNVVLLAMNNKVKDKTIDNQIKFKKYINKYLISNSEEFNKLNEGNLSIKFSLETYIKNIESTQTLQWSDLIDLLERILHVNILIIDILNENGIKIVCRKTNFKNQFDRSIILLKKKQAFELLIQLKSKTSIKTAKITKEFESSHFFVTFLNEYYTKTCLIKNTYPDSFDYIPLKGSKYTILKLDNQEDPKIGYIKYQIINSFNKVNYLMTNKKILIPVTESGIIDEFKLETINWDTLIQNHSKLITFKKYKKILNTLSNILSDRSKIEILGIVDTNDPLIGGIFTNYGIIIPFLKEDSEEKYSKYKKLDYIYYLDIDKQIKTGETKQGTLNADSVSWQGNLINKYNDYNILLKNTVFKIKQKLGSFISENLKIKNYILNLITDTTKHKNEKINTILSIFHEIIKKQCNEQAIKTILGTHHIDTILSIIINEILNDNEENLLLNNIIISDVFNKDEIHIKEGESALLNINDIKTWLKKSKKDDED